jgi:NAD(P)-dependent dehydrogenase (short-subunit alcohol dehydrogenase family)
MGILDGKVAVITGGGGGIGRAHALRFAREGCKVVVNDLGTTLDGHGHDSSVATRVVDEIRAAKGEATASDDDVSQRAGAERLMKTAVERYGRIDILLHCAGFVRDRILLQLEDDMWDASLAGHVRSAYLCFQAAARHMVERGGGGRLITTSSIVGLVGMPGAPSYATAKAGLYGLGRAAAMELQPHGITVNVISPIAYTRMTENLPVMKTTPNAAELFSPDFVADVTLFLVSDQAADITGAVVDVQGRQVSMFRMVQSAGVMPLLGDRWTPAELRQRWAEISKQ